MCCSLVILDISRETGWEGKISGFFLAVVGSEGNDDRVWELGEYQKQLEAVGFPWLVLEGFALRLTCRVYEVLGSCSPGPCWPLRQMRMHGSGSWCQILQQLTREQLLDSCQQEFRGLNLPCAAGSAKELIQCRDNKTRSVFFFPSSWLQQLVPAKDSSFVCGHGCPGSS